MANTIDFNDIENKFQCIPNYFDPIYNPSYTLINYSQSNQFLALILTGWVVAIAICVTKGISIWKGGISNIPDENLGRFVLVYSFYELTMAALLFAHFYIYEFFYFGSAKPCLGITNFVGL